MNSTAFSLLANNNSEDDENQKMELTIGSLSFCVGFSSSTHLSDLVKPDPSASAGGGVDDVNHRPVGNPKRKV
jgi:hypothetical protein